MEETLWTLAEFRKYKIHAKPGQSISFMDSKGRVRWGTVKIKEVRCGKENCTKCPHKSYAYAQFRDGKRVLDKYIGVVK